MSEKSHAQEPWKVGDIVETMFDTGAFGFSTLYGRVIHAGPKTVTIRWESGLRNRVAHGKRGIERARDPEYAREQMAKAEGR